MSAMNEHQSIDAVLKDLASIDENSFSTDGDRSKALLGAYALVSRLETPWDTVARLGMNQVSAYLTQTCSDYRHHVDTLNN